MKYTYKIWLLALASLGWTAHTQATQLHSNQVVVTDVADEEEADEEVQEDDETQEDDQTTPLNEAELPEGMTDREIDSLLSDWAVKNYINLEEACDPKSVNPAFPKEVYVDRLSRLQTRIEMPYNDIVRSYIDRYAERMRRTVSLLLGTSNFYMPIFEEALDGYQLPLELKYLPIIESALNPGATSRTGAAGLWQFMISTAKQYNLEVTSLIDERRDPIKASYAAAHYLKDLYGIFGDWTLSIAAYNCGPNNVLKAIKRAGGAKDFWAIYPYLPGETRGYVPAFIAANYIMNYYCDHNICPVKTRLPMATDTLTIKRELHFEQVAQATGVDINEIKALNPQYRTSLIPGHSHECTLKLPSTAINAFLEAGDSVYTYRQSELLTKRKEVEVTEPKVVTEVREKTTRSSRSSKSSRDRSSRRSSGRSVTVKKGETLSAIARRNGTTVEKLRRANGIRGNKIKPGQKLKLK